MPRPDYVITKVGYDEDHAYIQKAKRWEYDPNEGEVRNAEEVDRDELIEAVENDGEHYTAPRDGEGNLRWGQLVEVMEISEHRYVRSDSNPVRQDNLGDIEEYPRDFEDDGDDE